MIDQLPIRRWTTRVLAAGAVLAAGCTAAPPSSATQDDELRSAGLLPVKTRIDPACPTRRFVGIRAAAQCPSPHNSRTGRWRVGTPFASMYHQGGLPAQLDRYCMYEWEGSGTPDTRLLPPDGHRRASDWLDPDCQVVAPLGSAFETTLAPSLESAFMKQVQAAPLGVGSAHERASLISIIDASPGTPGNPTAMAGRSTHGYTVGRLARQVACQDPDDTNPARGCMAYLDSPLALPRVDKDTVDYASGGYFGSHVDLAAAIFDAVARYDDQGAAPIHHHILNLSVGWSPQYGGANPTDPRTPAPIRAVYDALEHARCGGALIIAAAGNTTGGPGPHTSGMMYPAAWTTESASCGGHLLVAAGGVNGNDGPLANGRPNSMPRLVVPGQHGVAKDRAFAQYRTYTPALSGTSVSAAVLSGAAAVVWGYNGTLSPEQVIETVYQGAFDLGVPADVCSASSCSVRRVSVCGAIQAACSSGAPACPSPLPTCAPIDAPDAPDPNFGGQPLIANLANSVSTTFSFTAPNQGYVAGCDAYVRASSAVPDEVCPLRFQTTAVARPYVDPQPGVPVCPECFMVLGKSTMTGYFAINPDLPGVAKSVTLDMTVDGESFAFELEPGSWSPGDVFKVVGIPLPKGEVQKAALSYVIVDGGEEAYANTEPLILY